MGLFEEQEEEREFEIGSNRRPSSSSPSNPEKMSSTFSGDETAPFFGFLGAAAALVFSCNSSFIQCGLIYCFLGVDL